MTKISELGQYGERLAKEILIKMGFSLVPDLLDSSQRGNPSYDILARRNGQKFAINVKYGNQFIIGSRNVERLMKVKEEHGYTPAYFFLASPDHFWFFSLDINFPKQIDIINSKLEVFTKQ